MKVLYIYRNPKIGFSIGKVFKPIEDEMKRYAEVDSIELPVDNYSLKGLLQNICYARHSIKGKKYDVIHITGSEHYLVPFLIGQNVVVTVHDLGSIRALSNPVKRYVKKLMFIDCLRWANRLTFISPSTFIETMSAIKYDKKNCKVIPNARTVGFERVAPSTKNDKPVVLHIGTTPNKNLRRVAEALKGIECELRIVRSPIGVDLDFLEDSGLNYKVLFNLTDQEIHDEYVNCDVVSFPSLYEGFGMPILEGQSIGRVVVTSDREPMKSVSGGASILVNPDSIESIRDGFDKAINNCKGYINRGYENVKKYDIETVGKSYYNLYAETIK